MIRRLREFSRWHIEKHLLGLVMPRPAQDIRAVQIADTLLPDGWIGPGWRCYCAGVGEDIRLDRYLAEQLGAHVWAFDFTPRSIAYMRRTAYDRTRLTFVPAGLWSEDATLRFHGPENPEHVSHSITEDMGAAQHFDAPCRSIVSLMREFGHDRLDLLKMNIEGAEHIVLGAALDARILPRVIALTYEGDHAFSKARLWTDRLRAEGYELLGRLGWFFTYVRRAIP